MKKWKERASIWWARSKNSRQAAKDSLKKAGRKGLTLAISMLGATLVSFGVYEMYAPAGYVIAGLLVWVLQWNEGSDG